METQTIEKPVEKQTETPQITIEKSDKGPVHRVGKPQQQKPPLEKEVTETPETPTSPQNQLPPEKPVETEKNEGPLQKFTEETPSTPETFDESAFLSRLSVELNQNFKSIEDVKNAFQPKGQEDPLDAYPEFKKIRDWQQKTNRPLHEWVQYNQDYNKLSEEEVSRVYLKQLYPNFSDSDVQLELDRYKPNEDDTEDEIRRKNLERSKFAADARRVLNEQQIQFDTPSKTYLTPEVQQAVEFYNAAKEQHIQADKSRIEFNDSISQSISEISKIALPLGKEDDIVNYQFNITTEHKKDLANFINEMPHWRNSDGSINPNAVVKDGIRIKYSKEIDNLILEQGKHLGKLEAMKEINNTNLESRHTHPSQEKGAKGPRVIMPNGSDFGGGKMNLPHYR